MPTLYIDFAEGILDVFEEQPLGTSRRIEVPAETLARWKAARAALQAVSRELATTPGDDVVLRYEEWATLQGIVPAAETPGGPAAQQRDGDDPLARLLAEEEEIERRIAEQRGAADVS